MTSSYREPVGPAPWAGGHASEDLLAGYAAGTADAVIVWSVEAHLTACPRCRCVVSAHVDAGRLARNRSVLLTRAAIGDGGRTRRLLSRCGVPDHLLDLVAATPSLRRSWLLSVAAVLAVVAGEAAAVKYGWIRGGTNHGLSALRNPAVLAPFLLVAPLLVLAGVAAAFLPMFDPAYPLAVAAPFSSMKLLLVRAVSALTAALVLVVGAAFFLPGPGWLPIALLLPSLALCSFTLAAATVMDARAAAVTAGIGWALPALLLALTRVPLQIVRPSAQLACAAVLCISALVLYLRQDRSDLGMDEMTVNVTTTTTAAVAVDGLSRRYGAARALDEVSLTLDRGITGLLGPNGAGKTTLLSILATVNEPDAGRVRVLGLDPRESAERLEIRRRLGYLPQELGYHRHFTVAGFLDYVAILKEMTDRRRRAEEVARVLAATGLDGRARTRIRTLSGGMRQRLGIAQALLGRPELLILDEPTAGLDPEQRLRFRELISDLPGDPVIMLSTHQADDIAAICPMVVVLLGGRVHFAGTPSELAATAAGRVWAADNRDASAHLSWRGADNRWRHVGEQPPAGAELVAPTVEDGYLLLSHAAGV